MADWHQDIDLEGHSPRVWLVARYSTHQKNRYRKHSILAATPLSSYSRSQHAKYSCSFFDVSLLIMLLSYITHIRIRSHTYDYNRGSSTQTGNCLWHDGIMAPEYQYK